MKRIIYIITIGIWAILGMTSCNETDIDFNAIPVSEMAEYQISHYAPVTKDASNNIYKIELDGKLVSNNTNVLAYYNTSPGGGVGRFFVSNPGKVNLKLYQGTELNLVYDQDIILKKGKQNIIVHDYNTPPVILDRDFEGPYPLDPSEAVFDTDTIGYVRFINLMYETDNQPTTMKLQYQYQYTLHPLYTYADRDAGKIPEGMSVGDATGDTTKSPWLNLGEPVGFGESTGFHLVPVKKSTQVAQGAARIDYRIVVSAADGGIPGNTVIDDIDWQLRVNSGAYTDYWNLTVGRYATHYFAGYRTKATEVAVYNFYEH